MEISECTHPARGGHHEEYSRPDGSSFCRACGEEIAPQETEVADIVDDLRKPWTMAENCTPIMRNAADEIERLRSLLSDAVEWNWIDHDAEESIPRYQEIMGAITSVQ